MRLLGLVAIYQRPNPSKSAEAHKIYPYLLGGMAIERVNQVWCADVTYIPMPKGFLYLVVIMDWVSRAVLAWRLSNTLGPDFCVEALEEAGTCRSDVKGEIQAVSHCKDQSTDAEHRGGGVRNRDEGAVMALDRRDVVIRPYPADNLQGDDQRG